MATRYWVGGAGTWNASTTTNWSATSGGAGGASAPTSTDDVVLDTNSGTGAIPCVPGAVCQNLTVTATQALILGDPAQPFYSAGLSVYGALSIVSGGSFTINTGTLGGIPWTITFASNNTTKSFVTGGKALPICNFNGGSDVFNMGDAITSVYRFNLGGATINTNNYNLTGSFYMSSGVFNAGSSTITLPGTGGGWSISNTTLNMGTSTITAGDNAGISDNSSTTYYNIIFTGDSNTITYNITCTNLTVSKFLRFEKTAYVNTTNITVTGTFTANGSNPYRITISGCGTTITAATVSMSYVNFWKVTGAGAGSWTGTSIGDMGGNSGITFTTPKTVYAVSAGSPNWGDNIWSTSSGGSVSTANFPLPQDTAIINNSSCASGGEVVFLGINKTGTYSNVNYSTRTNPITLTPGGITSGGNITGRFNGTLTLSSAVTVGNWAGLEFAGNCTFNSAGVSIPNAMTNSGLYDSTKITLAANCTFTGGTLNNYSVYFGTQSGYPTLDLNGYTFNATQSVNGYSTQGTIYLVGPGTISSTLATGNVFYFLNSVGSGNATLTSTGAGNRTIRVPDGGTSVNISNSGTITFGANSPGVNSLNMTGFTGTMGFYDLYVAGNLTLSSGGSYGTTGAFYFVGTSGTSTITTAGQTLSQNFIFDCAGKTYVFADALTQGSTTTFTITNGTVKFKASTTNTVGSFLTSGTNTKYLASTTSGTRATVTQASGAVSVSYLAIKDSAATGGATWNASYARSNINQGNNTGWFFSSNSGSFFFLMG